MAKLVRKKEPDLHEDAWDRFERAVDVVAKSPPHHRAKAKDWSKMSMGAKVVLNDRAGEVISGHLLLPDGSRVELPPEAVGNRK